MAGANERAVRRPRIDPAHVVDVFVYVVVLNLAAEYAPQVITESFTTSLAVALLLKVVLEVVLRAKQWAMGRFSGAETPLGKTASALALVVVLPGSKILVLELVAFVFGDAVSLGGFFLVTGLIFTLLLARFGVRRLLALDDGSPEPATPQVPSR